MTFVDISRVRAPTASQESFPLLTEHQIGKIALKCIIRKGKRACGILSRMSTPIFACPLTDAEQHALTAGLRSSDACVGANPARQRTR